MGRSPCDEQTTLVPRQVPLKPLKFPLGLVSESVRPYLELIRLEKVSFAFRRLCFLLAHYFIMPAAHRNDPYVLAFWCVI